MSSTFAQTADVLSSYFVQCYWVSLYEKTRQDLLRKPGVAFIDHYHANILDYNRAFNSPEKPYQEIFSNLWRYYARYIKVSDGEAFLDDVLKHLLPAQHLMVIREDREKKGTVLREILRKTMGNFSLYCSKQVSVLEAHEKDAWRPWKKEFLRLFQEEKKSFTDLLFKQIGESAPPGPPALEKVYAHLQEMCRRNAQLVENHNNSVKLVESLKGALGEKEKMVARLVEEVKELRKNLEEREVEIESLRETIGRFSEKQTDFAGFGSPAPKLEETSEEFTDLFDFPEEEFSPNE